MLLGVLGLGALTLGFVQLTAAEDATGLDKLAPEVLTKEQRKDAAGMIERDINRRSSEVNARNREQWARIPTREQWEKYRDERVAVLRRSLGEYPAAPARLNVQVTGVVDGDGFKIANLVYETRPGFFVTANLYSPAKPTNKMPGILIISSHHNPKTQSELQAMGMTWARLGCAVLVMDQLGHGERRQHPFLDAASYPKPFRPSRQDYYFRYNTGIQLHLIGDGLIGPVLLRCVRTHDWSPWASDRGAPCVADERVRPVRVRHRRISRRRDPRPAAARPPGDPAGAGRRRAGRLPGDRAGRDCRRAAPRPPPVAPVVAGPEDKQP